MITQTKCALRELWHTLLLVAPKAKNAFWLRPKAVPGYKGN